MRLGPVRTSSFFGAPRRRFQPPRPRVRLAQGYSESVRGYRSHLRPPGPWPMGPPPHSPLPPPPTPPPCPRNPDRRSVFGDSLIRQSPYATRVPRFSYRTHFAD